MLPMDRRTVLAGAGAGVMSLGLGSGATSAQGKETLLGIPVETSNSLMFMVAQAAGYFKEEGLPNPRVTMPSSGTNVRQMLAAGQMPYALGDPVHPLAITGAGKPGKILMATDTRASIAMIVRQDLFDKGITTPKALGDLKKADGAKPIIGVTQIGAQTWLYGDQVMRAADRIDNINFVSIGEGASMLGSLKSGRVDAVMGNSLIYFATQDEKLGTAIFNSIDEKTWLATFGSTFPGQVCFALADQVKNEPAMTQAFVNAIYRALKYVEKTHPAEIVKLVQTQFMTNYKPEVAQREIEFLKPIFSYAGDITEQQFNAGGKVWFSEGTKVKPQAYKDMVDLSFLAKARAKFG